MVSTDESPIYFTLNSEFGMQHGTVNHSAKEYRRGAVSTNTIEGFFGQLKRMVHGTHLHVSKKYLQNYVGECVLRYNNRKQQAEMFEVILNHLPLFQ
jgi:transposase